jgi:hypothetical protein
MEEKMNLIKLNPTFFDLCKDPELLHDHLGRPCVLIMHLVYKGRRMDFAAPLRSKLSQSTPRNQLFQLPPSPDTPSGKIHGIHFSKMHPITKEYIQKYAVGGKTYHAVLLKYLDAHEREIVLLAQEYLTTAGKNSPSS